LTPTHDALETLLQHVTATVGTETVPVSSALGRITAEDIISPVDLPPFERAAMDGYAIRAEDTYSASTSSPVTLRSIGDLQIGEATNLLLGKNETASIVTGAQMPASANAVVMVEYTKKISDDQVEIYTESRPGENISRVGEDVQKGDIVFRRGIKILPPDVGMLTSLGLQQIPVVCKPRIAILSTGNELRHDAHTIGKIADANRPMLISAVKDLGCEPVDMGIVGDDAEAIHDKLLDGIRSADAMLVTAGTSVGPHDIVPKVIDSIGKPGMLVHGVAMRPSMPTGLAAVDGKAVISLPGYPVSAYIAFIEFVRPLIAHLLRTKPLPPPTVKARLSRRIAGILGSRTYIRVKVTFEKTELVAEPIRTSGAGILSSLIHSNGFIIVPEHVEGYEEGELVDVELYRPWETSGN